jgi:hypothetical protein
MMIGMVTLVARAAEPEPIDKVTCCASSVPDAMSANGIAIPKFINILRYLISSVFMSKNCFDCVDAANYRG